MHILPGTILLQLAALWPPDPVWQTANFKDVIVAIVMMVLVVSGVFLVATNARRIQQSVMQKRLLEKFSSAHDFAEFMQSPAGQKYVMSFSDQVSNPRNSILSSVQIGIVTLFMGPALITAGMRYHLWMLDTLGLISVCLGVGFLVSAAASYFLAKKISLGEKE